MDNEKLLGIFFDYLRTAGYASRTIESYQSILRSFFIYLAAHQKEAVRLTAADLQEYRLALYYQQHRGNPLAIQTQANWLAKIRVFFRFLAKENLIFYDPAAALELPKVPRGLPKNIITAREAKKVLESINTNQPLGLRDRAMLELLYSSGIRVSELIHIQLADVDLNQGMLHVVKGKGDKDRIVPVGQIACRYIREYIQTARPQHTQETTLFLSCRGLPLAKQNIEEICEKQGRRAGVKKKVTPHTFRHTCATEMLKNSVDIRYIQELLGHSSLKSTQVYTKVTVKDLKKVHARCHPREKERD